MNLLNEFYTKDWLFFNILGTKKNFFRWLNFLKYSLPTTRALIYVYTPCLFYKPIKIKKIKAIKRKFRKDYLYKEIL